MSIVTDRQCDGCLAIKVADDDQWLKLVPSGWDGEDRRLDFCDLNCLRRWVKGKKAIP